MSSTPEDRDDWWSSESEALFRAARSDNEPSAADRERVRRIFAQRLAEPQGNKAVRYAGVRSARLLQLGVGVTFVVLAAEAARVLALCREHERRWAHGTFEQEPEGLRAIASCRKAVKDPSLQARRFFDLCPRSTLGPQVRAACLLPLKAAE